MTIQITRSPIVYISQEQMEDLRREYNAMTRYMVDPPSFEVWAEKRAIKSAGERP